jgi:gliding motility-associated-like protein
VVTPPTASIESGESVDLVASGGDSYTWTPSTGLSCTDCPNPTASPLTTTTYTVSAVDEFGCQGDTVVTIFVEQLCGELFVPTIFSPNADNVNDKHCVLGGCFLTFEFSIYNRWGERVFESTSASTCWDGMFREKPAQTGVYVYKLKAVLIDGTEVLESGNINLVR